MYDFGIRQAHTGYRVVYRAGEVNHCPGCGRSHWLLGRQIAECAYCGTPVEIMNSAPRRCPSVRAAA